MPETFNPQKALPLVLFAFVATLLFSYMRLNAPLKEVSQLTLNLMLISLPVITVSLAANKKWLPIADMGDNVLGLFGAGLILSTVILAMPGMVGTPAAPGVNTGNMIFPYLELQYGYATFVGIPLSSLSTASLSERDLAINYLALTVVFVPIAEEFAFLTFYFLLCAYFANKFNSKFLGILMASVIVGVFFTTFHYSAYAYIYNAQTLVTSTGQVIPNPDYIPNLSPFNPSSIAAMLSTKVGFSAFVMRMVLNIFGLLTGAYIATIGLHMGVNFLVVMHAAAVASSTLFVVMITVGGSLILYSRFVQKKTRFE